MKTPMSLRPIQEYEAALAEAVKLSGLDIDKNCQQAALAYAKLLLEWNQVMNLTALTLPEEVAMRHFIDSWMMLPLIDKLFSGKTDFRLIDVGTGAGFPGLPLKLARPDIKLVLLDSLQKRVKFLNEVVSITAVNNVECVHGRAEEAGRKKGYRDRFDIATARAVASLPELSEYCLPFVKPGGYFIAMKSDAQEELKQSEKAIGLLAGKVEEVSEFTLPGTDMKRSLIVIRKMRPTPAPYPRKAGKPHASPLL